MVVITYNESNKEELELIEDYFFYEYYCRSLRFDYGVKLKNSYKFDDYKTILNKGVNKIEYKRACKIHKKIYYDNQYKRMPDWFFLDDVIRTKPEKIYKYKLIARFGKGKESKNFF